MRRVTVIIISILTLLTVVKILTTFNEHYLGDYYKIKYCACRERKSEKN